MKETNVEYFSLHTWTASVARGFEMLSKYYTAKTLETFSAKLRNERDLEALNSELVEVVVETVQPTHLSLWFRPDAAAKEREHPG